MSTNLNDRRFQQLQKQEEAVFRDLVGKEFRSLETLETNLNSAEQLLGWIF